MTAARLVLACALVGVAAGSFALGIAAADRAERRAPVEREGLAEAKHPWGAKGRVLGSVTVRRGDTAGPAPVVRRINAGETARIRAGQWIVEQPTTIHRAANRGDSRVVISLATLLRRGAQPSVPVAG